MKKLQVPFNLDLQILNLYKEYSKYISEIYFPLHPSIFPSARQNDYPGIEKYNEIISKESLLKPNGQHYFSIRNKEGGHKCGQMHMKQLPVFSRTVTWNPITRSDCPLSI